MDSIIFSIVGVCVCAEVALVGCLVMFRRGYVQIASLWLLLVLSALGFGLLTNAYRIAMLAG